MFNAPGVSDGANPVAIPVVRRSGLAPGRLVDYTFLDAAGPWGKKWTLCPSPFRKRVNGLVGVKRKVAREVKSFGSASHASGQKSGVI